MIITKPDNISWNLKPRYEQFLPVEIIPQMIIAITAKPFHMLSKQKSYS
jgi:hypothetical protein